MSNVYANGREVSAKKDANKSLCAMPDVCLSPPSPPAGPVPVPYPNTARASDTSSGSKKVKIGGKEVGLKNKSNYKKSKGNEAATRSFGMGVVTHTIQGKMKHAAWSMDVKIEGQNVIRHMDMTTHNHINNPNIAVQLNQADENIEMLGELTCEDLKDYTEFAEERNLRDSAEDTEFTVTAAAYRPTRPPAGTTLHIPGEMNDILMQAVTPGDLVRSDVSHGFAPPRNCDQTMACNDTQWGAAGNNNHTEPKLIEQIFEAAGSPKKPRTAGSLGTLRMRISRTVCPRCQKGICEAVRCGLEIVLCEGEPPQEERARKKCKSGEFQRL